MPEAPGGSPERIDALVWAVNELEGIWTSVARSS
jgi:phage terminase large subunit-like protein